MGKQATSQVDWIFSVVIFMVYLTWFFIYIQPIAGPSTQDTDGLLRNLQQGIEENATGNVQLLPLFVRSNVTGAQPLIVEFSHNWTNFSFSDNRSFVLLDGRLFFHATLSGNDELRLARSEENYTVSYGASDLSASESAAVTPNFRADFANGFLSGIAHAGSSAISATNISVDGSLIDTSLQGSSFASTPIVARYHMSADALNITSYVMRNQTRVDSFVDAGTGNHSLTLGFALQDFTSYYVNPDDSGSIGCDSRETRYLDVSKSSSGLTFIFTPAANVTLCGQNIIATLPALNSTRYTIIARNSTYNATLAHVNAYSAQWGFEYNVTGILLSKISGLNSSDYGEFKERAGYPSGRDYSWSFVNQTPGDSYYFGQQPQGLEDVFVREKRVQAIDSFGNRKLYILRVRGW